MTIDDNINGIEDLGDPEDLIMSDIQEQEMSKILEQQILIDQTEKIITCAFDRCSEMDIVNCRKCSRPFCIMHSNRFSPNFCKECFSNIACMESRFTRTFEDYDEKTDNLVVTKQSC